MINLVIKGSYHRDWSRKVVKPSDCFYKQINPKGFFYFIFFFNSVQISFKLRDALIYKSH